MAATLTDVARRAGVSVATASRAYGEPDRLAPATLQRVLDAAAELGYASPQPAPAKTLAVVVPDLANPVYATQLKAIQLQAWHARHLVVVFDTDEDLHREREQIEHARRLDGLLLCSPRLPADQVRRAAGDVPLVVLNREVEGARCVLMSVEHGLRQAVEHLAALGHEHVAYAAGPLRSWADEGRAAIMADGCRKHGLRLTRLNHQAASVAGGRAAAATALASGASAVVAYNDSVALGLEAGIVDLGRSCPEDLSIVGIDDIEIAATVHPGLTTVQLPIERAGTLGVELLLRVIGGERQAGREELSSQLIVRGSTAVPPPPPSPATRPRPAPSSATRSG